VHGADRIEGRRERVLHVLVQVTGSLHVDGQESTAATERTSDVAQRGPRLGLIVDGVEDGDEVVSVFDVQSGHVLFYEARVGQPQLLRFRAPGGDTLGREVVAGEATGREGLRHQVQGVAGAAGNVGDVEAGGQSLGEPGVRASV